MDNRMDNRMENRKHILLIGYGAIGAAVASAMREDETASITHLLVRPGRETAAQQALGSDIQVIADLPAFLQSSHRIDVVADCAGHSSLAAYGAQALAAGIDVLSLSCGALSDTQLAQALAAAASTGRAQLRLLSGAIAGLDALSAGAIGELHQVHYRGRKPPQGWAGSAAEASVDLASVTEVMPHFTGSARDAAKTYPKNANVAASIALAGTGLDDTEVELLVDPHTNANVHELEAHGEFGSLSLRIEGHALKSIPRSSALAAFSMIRALKNRYAPICVAS